MTIGDSVRKLDHMGQCALRGYDEEPYLMKSSSALIPQHVLPSGPLPIPRDHSSPLLREVGRKKANRMAYDKLRLLRFTVAASGVSLVIVPMLIMANVPGKVASLVTTCVAILIFAALVTLVSKLSPNEVLATTAAYAAILAVFVGASLSYTPVHTGLAST